MLYPGCSLLANTLHPKFFLPPSETLKWTHVEDYHVTWVTGAPGWPPSSFGSNHGQTPTGVRGQHRLSAGARPPPLNKLQAPICQGNPGWEASTLPGKSDRKTRRYRRQSLQCPLNRKEWRNWKDSVCSFKTFTLTCWPNTSTEACCTGTKIWL